MSGGSHTRFSEKLAFYIKWKKKIMVIFIRFVFMKIYLHFSLNVSFYLLIFISDNYSFGPKTDIGI